MAAIFIEVSFLATSNKHVGDVEILHDILISQWCHYCGDCARNVIAMILNTLPKDILNMNEGVWNFQMGD